MFGFCSHTPPHKSIHKENFKEKEKNFIASNNIPYNVGQRITLTSEPTPKYIFFTQRYSYESKTSYEYLLWGNTMKQI